jgi:putative ABC transport system permease protein
MIAFLLAAIGIHGLLSFTVSNRTQEIGVRIALGARRADILGMILRDSVFMGIIGVAGGAALSYAAAMELRAMLAGIQPGDPSTFGAAIGLCLLMTLAGSAVPAIRAIGIDPVKAIRTE